jgi:Fe-S-cluster containining protein
MAELTFQEMEMTSKFFGDKDLVHNKDFWLGVFILYQDKVVPLPLVDNPQSRRRLHDMLKCPPGNCGDCCHYNNVPLSDMDIKRLNEHYAVITNDNKLDCSKGCQFLKDNQCSIYSDRPDVCVEFPIQSPREGILYTGEKFQQVQYRVKCIQSIDVIRTIMEEACASGDMMLLPDLSLIPVFKKESNNAKTN